MKTIKVMSFVLIVSVTFAFTTVDFLDSDDRKSSTALSTELEQLPKFEVELLDSDKAFNSKDLNGKYTLIDVWSPSCGVCVKHVPSLQKLNENYSSEKFEIVSIALSTKERVRKFRQDKYPMPWKHALVERSLEGEIVQALEVKSTPTYYFVSPEGKVLATNEDFEEEGSFSAVIGKHL